MPTTIYLIYDFMRGGFIHPAYFDRLDAEIALGCLTVALRQINPNVAYDYQIKEIPVVSKGEVYARETVCSK